MKKTVRDVDLRGKRVLVRVDYNVPLDATGAITDSSRIRETLPTLRYLRDGGCRVVLVSHLGRPDGKVDPRLTLEPVARELSAQLAEHVEFARDTIGPDARGKAAVLPAGGVLLLENVRFHAEEEANDPSFAAQLAAFGDVFVNDAFGTAHRAHASTAGVTAHLPAVAGLLMERELRALGRVLEEPEHPLVAVIGGAKVSSKIAVLENLISRVDALVVGGGMACTFLKAQGFEVGRSLLEADRVGFASDLLDRARTRSVRFALPVDGVCVDQLDEPTQTVTVPVDRIPAALMMVDIGPRSVDGFAEIVGGAKTILWNGPMGVFEREQFATGTAAMARAIAESGAMTVVGGGDTVAAIERYSDPARFTHVSTGGGASLEFLEGRALPGVEALDDMEEGSVR